MSRILRWSVVPEHRTCRATRCDPFPDRTVRDQRHAPGGWQASVVVRTWAAGVKLATAFDESSYLHGQLHLSPAVPFPQRFLYHVPICRRKCRPRVELLSGVALSRRRTVSWTCLRSTVHYGGSSYSSSFGLNHVSSGTVPFSNSPIITISSALSCTNFAGRRSIISSPSSSRPNQTGSANFTGSRVIN